MNNSESIWGSLVATLEDQCNQVFNSVDNSRQGSDPTANPASSTINNNGTGLPDGVDNLHQQDIKDSNELPFASLKQTNVANIILRNRIERHEADAHESSASPRITSLKLKQWTKRALQHGGISASSPSYLEAAITIAISLVNQLIQAEKLARFGISDKLDLCSACMKTWVECVVVHLKDEAVASDTADIDSQTNDNEWAQRNPPRTLGQNVNQNSVEDQDINQQLESFLESFEKRYSTRQAGMPLPAGSDEKLTDNEECNYLCVGTAEIRCPENIQHSVTKHPSGVDNAEAQRMFYLGLVFYELFSGGDSPPRELYKTLPSSQGAFVSLPKLTLVLKEDHEESPITTLDYKRRQGPTGSTADVGECQLSLQYLKLKGLPGPICHLIYNMLDCIHGDLGGDECYTKLTDVMADLTLMQDKPDKFLWDLNVDKLSVTALQLGEDAIPREVELDCIKDCYRRGVSGSCELVVIKGESGSGKSWLAQRVGQFVTEEEGGVFFTGKFDQMKQMKPFSALASAFDQYCDLLIREKDSMWAKGVVDQLNSSLGHDACHLIKLIPKLSEILDNTAFLSDSKLDQNCAHSEQRLHYLLTQFVDAISMNSCVSVTLFLDDIQWADEATIAVLNLLLRKEHKKFFYLWGCRDDEMETGHPILQLIDNVRSIGVHATVVTLKCLGEDELNRIMSDLLCLSPRIVRPLSNIVYKKTKGNPLFFSQLLLSLNRNGLIRINFDTRRWVWDEEKIHSMKLPDNVALCFANGIKKLPFDVQLALRTLSMFGASAKINYIQHLEKELDFNLTEPLKLAAAEGLVSHINGSIQFNHDRIQEVVYGMIDDQERLHNHLKVGDCFVKLSQGTGDVDMMFLGVHQINLAGPEAVTDADELATMARYNLTAGKRAMEMSGFASAFKFFFCGTKFLPANHWSSEYDLSLELFELASKVALVSGNESKFGILSDEVLNNARCFEDKLNINLIIMASPNTMESLEMGRAILSRLGEDIPNSPSSESLDEHIRNTQEMIKGLSEDDLLNYRLMTDAMQLMKMKFLAKTESTAVQIRPDLHPFITLKMVQLTVSHGLSPTAPIVFVAFGSLLAKAGNLQIGYKFAQLSLRLLDKLNANEIKGEVITAVTEIQCFVEPILATNELRAEGERASILAGDVYFGCISRLHYCLVLLWGGINLKSVMDSMKRAVQYMKDQGESNILLITIIAHRTVSTLIGQGPETPTESELSRIIDGNGGRPRQLIIFSFENLYLAFLLDGTVDAVKEYAQKFLGYRKATRYILFSDTMHAYILGLSAFQICRECQSNESSQWFKIGEKCTSDMKFWAEQGSPWNFQHKYMLMKAEEHFCSGELTEAKEAYNNAIVLARNHKLINDEALACELAGKFHFSTGDLQTSLEYLRMAHECYINWGSNVKANLLFEFISEKFSGVLAHHISVNASQQLQDASRKRREC